MEAYPRGSALVCHRFRYCLFFLPPSTEHLRRCGFKIACLGPGSHFTCSDLAFAFTPPPYSRSLQCNRTLVFPFPRTLRRACCHSFPLPNLSHTQSDFNSTTPSQKHYRTAPTIPTRCPRNHIPCSHTFSTAHSIAAGHKGESFLDDCSKQPSTHLW